MNKIDRKIDMNKKVSKLEKKSVPTLKVDENRFDTIFDIVIINKLMPIYDNETCKFAIPEHVINEIDGVTINDITKEKAIIIYKESYYDSMNLNKLVNSKIAEAIFEFAVIIEDINLPIKMLKESFNLLNSNYGLHLTGNLFDKDINVINNYKYFKALYRTLINKIGSYLESLCIGDEETVRFNKLIYRTWVRDK